MSKIEDEYPREGVNVRPHDDDSDKIINKIVNAVLRVKPPGVRYMLVLVSPHEGMEALFDIATNMTPGQMLDVMEVHSERLKKVN